MTKTEFWEEIIKELQQSNLVKEVVLTAWFRPQRVLHVANGILLIKVTDSFAYDQFSKQYSEKILQAAQEIDSKIYEVRFTTEESVPVPRASKPEIDEQPAPKKKITPKELPKLKKYQHALSPDFNFDRFIAGYDNEFALKSAQTIAENPVRNRFSPLYIYGDVGLGKSHLLHAVGNLVQRQRPKFKVVLTTAEEFFHNYSASLQKKSKDSGSDYKKFFETFVKCDILLMDEIQFLSAKPQCQIEFFRIFNELHQRGVTMVFTADRPPEKLKMEERLISRLQWGLAVEIQAPQVETRLAILTEMAQQKNLDLPANVITFIAENGPSNIRELGGIVIRLLVKADLEKVDINLDTAEEVLNQRVLSNEQKFTLERIIEFTCDHFGVAKKLMLGKGRSKEVALARQVGMYIAKNHTKFSLKAIGLEFNRDHSTVVHAVKSVTVKLAKDSEFTAEINSVITTLAK